MKKYLTVSSSFFIMLCLGGLYAWSIIAKELIDHYNFSSAQTQVVFGLLIAVFPLTMIFCNKIVNYFGARKTAVASALFFFSGNYIASLSHGDFWLILLGIGLFSGIGTGLGYYISLTIPVKWFPEKQGMITGVVAAGFGLGAIVLSYLTEYLLASGKTIDELFLTIGISYGLLIFIFSHTLFVPSIDTTTSNQPALNTIKDKNFRMLFVGILLGTFSGLLVVGNLKLIGYEYNIHNHFVILGISIFALFNFLGRIVWGFMSDSIQASLCVFFSLSLQGLGMLSLVLFELNMYTYIALYAAIGFGFGGNFVLFAKETSNVFGIDNLGKIYPYVFLGYALAGIMGPFTGGSLFDTFQNFTITIILASVISLFGGFLFLIYYLKKEHIRS
jgi:OFA family oxalate/formate antiporter-like MFS transporter